MRLCSYFLPFVGINEANSLQFYDRTISFYDEGKQIEISENVPQSENKIQNTDSNMRSLDRNPFDWKNYENPQNVQFWDAGGDFVPSLPWRYLAVHPTDENIKNYIAWQNKKIQLSFDLQKRLAVNSQFNNANSEQLKSSKSLENKKINWNNFEILYFYQSHCPYCQMSNETFSYLKQMGAKVIPVQIDWDKNPPAHTGSIQYDEKLDAEFHVTTTPTWILKGNGNSKRINGYVTLDLLSNQAFDLLKSN